MFLDADGGNVESVTIGIRTRAVWIPNRIVAARTAAQHQPCSITALDNDRAKLGVALTPYYERDGITIYHGDVFDVIDAVESFDALITDPPYSSGGAFRGDRSRSTIAKYVRSTSQAFRDEFTGDTRDQRGFTAWASMWLGTARVNS